MNPDLAAACASADSLLTLVTLDPVSGGNHLASWANEAVAVVTAGRSSATRIRAVGEMIRLAGTRLVSVVLLKADKSDESLGALAAMEQSASPVAAVEGVDQVKSGGAGPGAPDGGRWPSCSR